MKRQMMIKIMNKIDLCLPTIIQVCQIENQNNTIQNNKIKSQCSQYGHFFTSRDDWPNNQEMSIWENIPVE